MLDGVPQWVQVAMSVASLIGLTLFAIKENMKMKCVNCGKGIHLYERSWVHDEHGNSGRGPQKCALSDLLIDLVAKIEQGEIITATPEGAQDERARFLKHYLKGGRTYMSGDEAREKHWETWQAAIQGQK